MTLYSGPVTNGRRDRMQTEIFGHVDDGTEVRRCWLEVPGLRVAILTYGGSIASLEVPDGAGRMSNVVLGLPTLAEYVRHSPYLGALLGRYANRIAQGRFMLDGIEHQLACNNGPNAIHGGVRSFSKRVWDIAVADDRRLELAYLSGDGEEGYPGKLQVHVTYSVTEDRTLRIDYEAETSAPTVLNLSNHTYWNLAGEGSGSALDHVVQIEADAFTPVDATQIPTGEIRPVDGTPFDFRIPRSVAARIREDDPQLLPGRGYDHNWVLPGGVTDVPRRIARMHEPHSGRVLEVSTTQPGMQFYSGNSLDGSLVGPGGHAYRQGDALVFETQHFPDSPNQPNFPSTVLIPGQRFRSMTCFHFPVPVG